MSTPFLFATGIENSYPTIVGGARIDQMDKCGHYKHWVRDFALLNEVGLNALRYGPPYYRVHVAPHEYDWSHSDEQMNALHALGVTVIADLCHFGVPPWLDGFQDEAFPVLFAEYARAFARRYPWVQHYTPVNEIFVGASFSALRGWWNECRSDDAAFVRALRNMCMAHELAVEAILGERPDAIIVQSESIEHFHPAGRDAIAQANHWNGIKHLSLDLTMGHELAPGMARWLHENGITSNDLTFFREQRAVGQRWLGVDYYPSCEHRIAATGRQTVSRNPTGFRRLATAYYERYQVPLFHCETNFPTARAVGWLDEQWNDVMAMRAEGIPVTGFTWFSLTDQIDWQHALRVERNDLHAVGLYDLNREIRPVGRRYKEIIAQWQGVLDAPVEGRPRPILRTA